MSSDRAAADNGGLEEKLCRAIITEEAVRYFAFKLVEHRMPAPAGPHEEALYAAAARGASMLPLGHLYRMAWSCARDAASAYQRHAGMPRENATVHAVNQFERWVQRASGDSGMLGAPFREDTALPLSADTDLVFRVILRLDPMTATPEQLTESLACAPDAERRWGRTRDGHWYLPAGRPAILSVTTDDQVTWTLWQADDGEWVEHSEHRAQGGLTGVEVALKAGNIAWESIIYGDPGEEPAASRGA